MKAVSLRVLVLTASLAGAANASSILYSNLSSPNPNASAPISATSWATTSFSTDNNSYTLADVIVALQGVSGGVGVNVNLYSDVANQPNTLLKSLGTISEGALSTASFTQQTVTDGVFTLAPNTTYFVVLSGLSAAQNDAFWEQENGAAATGITGSVVGIQGASANAGVNWSVHAVNSDFKPYLLQVDVASSTPEPGTLFGGLLSLGFILAARLRRPR